MTLDTPQRREGYASRSRPASDVHRAPAKHQTPLEMEYMTAGATGARFVALKVVPRPGIA